MKNILLRGLGLMMIIGFLALSHATISTYAAEISSNDRLTSENQGQDLRQNLRTTLANGRASVKEAEAFDIGYGMVWASMFSLAAVDDKKFTNDAILELADLIDRLAGKPEAQYLREVLRMVKQGKGTIDERFQTMDKAILTHRNRLVGTSIWYFDAGVALPYISVSIYGKNQQLLLSDLAVLEKLVATAPAGVPASILNPMRQVARYAKQKSFTEKDLLAIGQGVGSTVDAIYG